MVPTAKLKIECQMINPPKPAGCNVLVEGKLVAVVTLDDLRAVIADLERLDDGRRRADQRA